VVPAWMIALSGVLIFFSALTQGSLGFGFAILSVPTMGLLDGRLAPVPQLLLAAPLTAAMLFRERGDVDWRGVGWVLLGRLPGALTGIWMLSTVTPGALDIAIGACVLLGVVVLASGKAIPRRPLSQVVAGFASQVFAILSSIGGPPLALLYRDADAKTMRATLAAIFSIGVVITISSRVIASAIRVSDLVVAAYCLPGLAAGLWASRLIIPRLKPAAFRAAILVLSALASVGLVVRTVIAW
jgi:uncharacterized membrane protein YfcA